jgi:RNA 3'-terminal phosphate cyclase-like protein
LEYLPDVWIYSDFYKGDKASLSPGYSLSLQAETTTGATIAYDSTFEVGATDVFATQALNGFLDEVEHSGYISTNYQWFVLTLMALSERKTSSIKLGRISPYTVECLRILRDFFGIIFEIEES